MSDALLIYEEAEHGYVYIVGPAGKRYVYGFEKTDWLAKLGPPAVHPAADLATIPDAQPQAPAASITAQLAAIQALLGKLSGGLIVTGTLTAKPSA